MMREAIAIGLLAATPVGAVDLLGTPDLVTDYSAAMTSVGETTALVEAGGFLYAAYTDGSQNAVIARRPVNLPGAWDSAIVGSGVLQDAHNGASVGVGPDGTVHVIWDVHNVPLAGHYKRSSAPWEIDGMVPATVEGTAPAAVSYARFYRAGPELYLLLRDGSSGSGDEWLKRWTGGGWVDLAIPLISGAGMDPADNPYLGVGLGEADGGLRLVWTHRIGPYNYGVYYARYSPATGAWTGANGAPLTLPLTRESAGALVTAQGDPTLSNNGLGVYVGTNGAPGIVFSRHVAGHPEAFHARYDLAAAAWRIAQLSRLALPRLRACQTGSLDPTDPPRPCDYEMQGPFVTADGPTIRVFYTRTTGTARSLWVRPPGVLYLATSEDDGATWTTTEVTRPTDHLTSEVIRESGGRPYLLVQETSAEAGNLFVYDLSAAPRVRVAPEVSVVTGPSLPYLSIPDADAWSPGPDGFTLAAWVRPDAATAQPVAIVDKGGALDRREYRLLLYGLAPPFQYAPARVQVLLGAPSGWGLFWHPEIPVVPGEITHLALVWDRPTGELVLYRNGMAAATTAYAGTINNGASDVMIGANHTGAGLPEHFCAGALAVKFFQEPLNPEEIAALYAGGPAWAR